MPTDDNRKATLNARGRKLQRDAHGNILTRDSTKQQQKGQKELQNFLGSLNFFYEKVKRDPRRSCPFATGDSACALPNNEKRNMLYWWYATNVFLICGKGCRGPLPECLVYAIRCRYPNPKGVPYAGFLENDEETSRSKQKRQRN